MSGKQQHGSQESHPLLGIIFMLINALSIAIVYAAAKELTKELSSSLVVFLYKFSILLVAIPWCMQNNFEGFKTNRLKLHASRGFLSIMGSLCLYSAIPYIDLVDITAVGYIEQVILVIVGILYFKEKATNAKFIAIAVSFLGAMVVVYPDIVEFNSALVPSFMREEQPVPFNHYYIFVFLSIAFWATNCTVVKVLGRTEMTKVQLFYVMLFSSLWSFPMAFMKFEPAWHVMGVDIKVPVAMLNISDLGLKLEHLKYIVLLAICYFVHSVAFFKAVKYADLSTVIPFDYSRIVFTGVLGYVFFMEEPVFGSYVGYALIVIAGVYLVRSEALRKKKLKEQQVLQLEEEFEHA